MSHSFEFSTTDLNRLHHHLGEMTRILLTTEPGSDNMVLLADIIDTLPEPAPPRYSDIDLTTTAIQATHAICANENVRPWPPYNFIFVVDYDHKDNKVRGLPYAPYARYDNSEPQLLSFKPEELILTHQKWIIPTQMHDPYFLFHDLIKQSLDGDSDLLAEIMHLKPHLHAIAEHINAHYAHDEIRHRALTRLNELLPIDKIPTMPVDGYTYADHFMAEALTFNKERVFILMPDMPATSDYICLNPARSCTVTIPANNLILTGRKAELKPQPLI